MRLASRLDPRARSRTGFRGHGRPVERVVRHERILENHLNVAAKGSEIFRKRGMLRAPCKAPRPRWVHQAEQQARQGGLAAAAFADQGGDRRRFVGDGAAKSPLPTATIICPRIPPPWRFGPARALSKVVISSPTCGMLIVLRRARFREKGQHVMTGSGRTSRKRPARRLRNAASHAECASGRSSLGGD